MDIAKPVSKYRIFLESKDCSASISLNWFGENKTWMLIAYANKRPLESTMDIPQLNERMTAPSSLQDLDSNIKESVFFF
jgi:hypothetical protein